jgi:adenosylcobinamide kinase / adenosylcobinamide-phosphate guanylyltransferase
MGKIILILGGARSGKSRHALSLGQKHKRVAFIATCQALDQEMEKRIALHQQSRPRHWETFEEPRSLAPLLMKIGKRFDCIIVDCLTLWVSNLILGGENEDKILERTAKMLTGLGKIKSRVVLVSNEVGLGLVPRNKLGRDFRDIAGKVNQLVAQAAGEVFFTVSGIPVKIKGKR